MYKMVYILFTWLYIRLTTDYIDLDPFHWGLIGGSSEITLSHWFLPINKHVFAFNRSNALIEKNRFDAPKNLVRITSLDW